MTTAAPASRLIAPRRYDTSRHRRMGLGAAIGLFGIATLFAVLLGLGAASGQKLVVIGMAGILGGIAVLAVPVVYTFWVLVVMSFALTGPLTYFAKLGQTQWLPPLLCVALAFQVLVVAITRQRRNEPSVGIPAFAAWLVLFFVGVLFSSGMGRVTIAEIIMASRYYIFIWGAMMVFFIGAIDDRTIKRLWYALLIISLFQLPFALFQYFYVAKKRVQVVGGAPPWDAVIGTFPGNDTGGGNSAAMAIYLVMMILLALALTRGRRLWWPFAAAVVLGAIGAIMVAEVKGAVLLIPVVIAMYFRREIIRRPLEAIVLMMGAVLVAGGILFAYKKLHYEAASAPPNAAARGDLIDQIKHQLETDEGGAQYSGRLARGANLKQWWDVNVASGDLHHALLGWGMGTTQNGNIGVGRLAAKYGYDIDRTTFVILLWEVGVIGLFAFGALIASGAIMSRRLARDERIPDIHRIFLRVGAIGLFIFVLTLPYKSFAVRLTCIQLLIILMVGQAYYWHHRLKSEDLRRRLANLRMHKRTAT